MSSIHIPGAPGSERPPLHEPTEPRTPPPAKDDQREPAPQSPTGRPWNDGAAATGGPTARTQGGAHLTTAQGARLRDTDHSLKAGSRGPTLLQDHHLREKITHFDHERIPERVVHARGAAAHGVFESYGTAGGLTRARFLAEKGSTEVFVRFSTVLGSRGSADAVRDTRGFAVKFYTDEGTFDLVGNNIPVFFVQDGIKFPDVIHAAKPHPDREIPQAQSAHDTFWDFVSLHTEAQHHTIWNMSDRGIPRSYRMMEGFGVHTFRLVAPDGGTVLVKFHWKPQLGVHSLVWEEAQLANGFDPDMHRRDLADAIESGAHPQWELGLQVFPDTEEQTFEGIDLLDPTKLVPEELAPVQPVGRLSLTANPTNYFAETEQVAFHPGHLVPGIEVTDDPLLQARLFSYLDTQISRLGGPNFSQIPVNRPHAPVNDMLRDGMHQTAVHEGVAPYRPNSLDGGCPFTAGAEDGALLDFPQAVPAAERTRANPRSFEDHFSQATLFYRSLSAVERAHVAQAYAFELGKCCERTIKERQLGNLARIDGELAAEVAEALGMDAPAPASPPEDPAELSPALSQVGGEWPLDGRQVGIVLDAESTPEDVRVLRDAVAARSMVPLLIAPTEAPLTDGTPVQRTWLTARSVEFDALVFLAGDDRPDPRVTLLAAEAYRHSKALAFGPGSPLPQAAGIETAAPGVLTGTVREVLGDLFTAMSRHRAWERFAPRQ
ncbi:MULTISPECIES: catalase [Brevibacterium]|uniref:Catalase n=1 Tax=Brevibacterium salitolerans TaxID=1403566 RepID=A0ABN2WE05_9MICO|nr:catalase [Brevibacterium sp.]